MSKSGWTKAAVDRAEKDKTMYPNGVWPAGTVFCCADMRRARYLNTIYTNKAGRHEMVIMGFTSEEYDHWPIKFCPFCGTAVKNERRKGVRKIR